MKFCSIDPGVEGGVTFIDYPRGGNLRAPISSLDDVPLISEEDRLILKEKIKATKAHTIICPACLRPLRLRGKSILFAENPRLYFMKLLAFYNPRKPKIHESAAVHPCVTIGRNVSIGANCTIGGPGFGMWRRRDGSLMPFEQIGSVSIEDDVEIHANVCIDRGALGVTRIGKGTKIDNLVHVAHNCDIGEHCAIVANVFIGGSCKIGNRVWIGPNAALLNGIMVGNDAIIGIGAIVLRDVKANEKVHGVVK
jgi:UDP-3-O-[3-hydroxymyristoyl] glucosamine N-acyltransferase